MERNKKTKEDGATMEQIITKKDIKENSLFFWFSYFSWFHGAEDYTKELHIADVLQEIISVNIDRLNSWYKNFFICKNGEARYIVEKINDTLSFQIEFQEDEILFFINDEYIGNLGGHFECWFLTLEELQYFENTEFDFLLLLPMLGITKKEFDKTKKLISKNIATIPELKQYSNYIAECITNGLLMQGEFYLDKEVGIVNNQNHSIRNIVKYPRYKESVIKLNKLLKTKPATKIE